MAGVSVRRREVGERVDRRRMRDAIVMGIWVLCVFRTGDSDFVWEANEREATWLLPS